MPSALLISFPMEFPDISSAPILLSFLLFAFTLLMLKLVYKSGANSRIPNAKPLPGPWKLPLIGNLHQLASSDLPHRRLRDLAKKHGPLMLLHFGQVPNILVSSPEVAKQVLKTHDVAFASRSSGKATQILTYNYSGITSTPYGDSWKRLKKICVQELLNAKKIQSFRSIREEEVSDLINWISPKGGSVINLTDKVLALISGILLRAVVGNKTQDHNSLITVIGERETISGIADMFPSIGLLTWVTGTRSLVERLHKEGDRIAGHIIDEHKKRRAVGDYEKDLVDALLRIQETGDLDHPLTTNNIKTVVSDIFSAGSTAPAVIIDWAMCELMRHPGVMEKAQAEVRQVFNEQGNFDETGVNEMTYLKLVVKETLRLHPPVCLIPRETTEACTIDGFEIPPKTKVSVNAWAIGRDPDYWTEPESFIPERFLDVSTTYKGSDFEYIPFGGGRRMCPGFPFGLPSAELSLARLLYHFDWQLPNGMKPEELDMTDSSGFIVRRKQDLFVIPIPYRQSFVRESET